MTRPLTKRYGHTRRSEEGDLEKWANRGRGDRAIEAASARFPNAPAKAWRYDAQISALVTDDERVLDGDRFWVALVVGDGTYLAAWVDEDGVLKTASHKSPSGAIKLASSSWGR